MLMIWKSALLQHTTIFVWKVLRHVWVIPLDVTRGDEVWNSSQVWYMPFDDMDDPVTDEISMWPWREAYYTINVCNFILSRTTGDDASLSESMKRIKGQALFLRGYSYYTLAGYYQNPALITDYANYSSLDGLYGKNSTYDDVLDQVEKDFAEAMTLLPSRDAGGEWARVVLPAVLLPATMPVL